MESILANLPGKNSRYDSEGSSDPFKDFEIAYRNMPETIKSIGDAQSTVYEKIMACMSAIVVISGLAINVSGIYQRRSYFPNLFLIVLAAAASGKATISYNRKLISLINDEVVNASKLSYERFILELARYSRAKKNREDVEPPRRPPFPVVSLPSDITPSRLVQHLSDAAGTIPTILIDEEIDSSTASQKAHGSISHILRKAASNETISLSRKTDNEYQECKIPKLALIMSGTFAQITGLINDAENGTYSRSLFYTFDPGVKWNSVAPCDDCINLSDLYNEKARDFYSLWKYIAQHPTEVRLTDDQWSLLNNWGEKQLHELYNFHGEETGALVKRHALAVFKICMVLTAIRKYETKSTDSIMYCFDQDWLIALNIVIMSLHCGLQVVKLLPKATDQLMLDVKRSFLTQLANEFTRKDYLELALKLKIPERTVDRWVKNFVDSQILKKISAGHFEKPTIGNNGDGND